MKKITSFLTFCLLAFAGFCQTDVENLIQEGIALHDQGNYAEAIKVYEEALRIEPNSEVILYEISFSYFKAKDYPNAIEYAKKVIDLKGPNAALAYTNMGSSYDYMGNFKKAIKTFKKGIKKFPDYPYLHFNYGVTLYFGNEFEKAYKELETAVLLNPSHVSAHLFLGSVCYDLNMTTQHILSHYFFLFLEPTGDRSDSVWELFESNILQSPEKAEDNSIQLFFNPSSKLSEFKSADVMMTFLFLDLEIESDSIDMDVEGTILEPEKEGLSPFESFTFRSDKFLSMVFDEEREGETDETNLWHDIYILLLERILESEHKETFYRMISQGYYEESEVWVENHENEVDTFLNWFQNGE